MRIYFSEDEVCLDASNEEFANLKVALDTFTTSQADQLSLDTESGIDPHPYSLMLNKLILIKSDSVLNIYAEQSALFIKASNKHLELLAVNLPQSIELESAGIPYHVHFDRTGWPNEIAAHSVDLIFCVSHSGRVG